MAEGKVAVITGGASGIGLATARRLARDGWRLVLADVEAPRLDEAVRSFDGVTEAVGVVTDVADRASVEALADATYDRFERADVTFHNAGIAVGGPIAEMTHEDWRWTIDVDLWGPIHGVEAFLPRMQAQGGGGHLLFTASFAGIAPNAGLGPYCVAKYGVVALAEVLHRELRRDGIGVSVLCPMQVKTDVARSQRNRPVELGGPSTAPLVIDKERRKEDLAGRVLPAEDVAELVVSAIGTRRLYLMTHEESRELLRRRFDRIDHSFDEG